MFYLFMILMMYMQNGVASNPSVIHPHYTLDVYKTSHITAQEIDKKYAKELEQMAQLLLQKESGNQHTIDEMNRLAARVLTPIKQSGDYLYFGFSPVNYPGVDKIGFSIDVVDKKDAFRLGGFLPKPAGNYPDPDGLLAAWKQYEKFGFEKYFKSGKSFMYFECPAFHCLFGFDDPELVGFAKKFNNDVPRNKEELITILRHDQEDSKRNAAAYLLAHLTNGNEVIRALTPSIYDASPEVRNSVMRVLGEAVLKVDKPEINLDQVIAALDFPATTDRNKVLFLLSSLALKPAQAQYIKTHALTRIMSQYHLAQPNLHDMAHLLLIRISGKHFDLNDKSSWDNWASTELANQQN